jgi:hypothetical protein
MNQWLTVVDLCRHFEVARPTIQAWIDSGELRAKDFSRNKGGNRRWRSHVNWVREFESKSHTAAVAVRPRRQTNREPALRVRVFSP